MRAGPPFIVGPPCVVTPLLSGPCTEGPRLHLENYIAMHEHLDLSTCWASAQRDDESLDLLTLTGLYPCVSRRIDRSFHVNATSSQLSVRLCGATDFVFSKLSIDIPKLRRANGECLGAEHRRRT